MCVEDGCVVVWGWCGSCRDQEGRRGSDEVVPGPLVFPSREPSVSGTFAVASRVFGRTPKSPCREQQPHQVS